MQPSACHVPVQVAASQANPSKLPTGILRKQRLTRFVAPTGNEVSFSHDLIQTKIVAYSQEEKDGKKKAWREIAANTGRHVVEMYEEMLVFAQEKPSFALELITRQSDPRNEAQRVIWKRKLEVYCQENFWLQDIDRDLRGDVLRFNML